MRPIESKKSDPINKANQIELATFDPTECTRLIHVLDFNFNQLTVIDEYTRHKYIELAMVATVNWLNKEATGWAI